MIHSMTGFGRGEAANEQLRIQVDIRSVNHRYLDLQVRLPKLLAPMETDIRNFVKNNFVRGHVEVFVVFQRFAGGDNQIKANLDLASGYYKVMNQIAQHLQLDSRISLDSIMRQPGVLEQNDEESELELIKPLLEKALEDALGKIKTMREREGQALVADLTMAINRLRSHLVELTKQVPQLQRELEERFRQRIEQWAGETGVEETRLQQEAWIALSKMDVNEELSRLGGHLDEMERYFKANDAVGKRLDFLAQESHREINTCGNKVQGLQFSKLVVDIKTEVEKIREQVQNVE